MGDITAEIDQENKIITDLLSLVKMDKKAADLNVAPEYQSASGGYPEETPSIADKRHIDLIPGQFPPQ